MFFEKKKVHRITESPLLSDLLIAALVIIIIGENLYIKNPFPPEFWTIKLVDIINAIAQFATAGAFIFAVYQYRKSKETERQTILVKECKDLVLRMCIICNEFCENSRHGIKETSKFVTKMLSLGTSFNEIFNELNEDTHKAIVRMHWQEMYFSDLQHAMEQWSFLEILRDLQIVPAQADAIRYQYLYNQRVSRADISDLLAEYNLTKAFIKTEPVSSKLMKSAQISTDYLFFNTTFSKIKT
ncbi:hypothetical protein [Pseudomonas pergaminensis]|uniref:Phage abortive infection protein n=1 Tax=Pseudomonas pergaminensis TaxID=2853159 RepID=A0ABW8R6P6_9PSED